MIEHADYGCVSRASIETSLATLEMTAERIGDLWPVAFREFLSRFCFGLG